MIEDGDLSAQERIERARQARRKRERVQLVIQAVTVGAMLTAVWFSRELGPAFGVVTIGMTAVLVALRLFVAGHDDWHRRRALRAFAIGAAVGLSWLVVDALRITFSDADPASPSLALGLATLGWQTADLALNGFFTTSSEDG